MFFLVSEEIEGVRKGEEGNRGRRAMRGKGWGESEDSVKIKIAILPYAYCNYLTKEND